MDTAYPYHGPNFLSGHDGGKKSFYLKPAVAVVSSRRAGTTTTFDQINKYFTISQMPIISFRYWNMVHGATAEDVKKDLEGLQTIILLENNPLR